MADFTALKTAIQNAIKQNGNEEITGNLLQEVLLAIVSTLGDSAINDLIAALSTEVTNRQNADGTLQTNINNEATARGNADTALDNRIDNEATARENADTSLSNRITAITDAIENGYVYAGIATTSTEPATGKVFYLTTATGVFTNFGGITVNTKGIKILKKVGSTWTSDTVIVMDDTPTENSTNLVKSGGVYASIASVLSKIAEGYLYVGIATTLTNPSTPSGKVFYIAVAAGTYTNFLDSGSAALVLTQGINILKFNGASWSVEQVWGVDDEPTAGSDNLVKSGGVFNDIMTNGSAFDLSAYNNGTTYADLNAALIALNALPAAYKKGGMSMKFVRTSDNKYVQYRLMNQNFTTNTTQWQGVDDEPTAGSDNLVKSGGVAKAIQVLKKVELSDTPASEEVIEIKNESETETIVSISENGVDAKNLKSNGADVVTHDDLNIENASPTSEEGQEQVWCNNSETENYAKIGSYGIKAKSFQTLDGVPLGKSLYDIVVDANGGGDYTTIEDALNNAGDTQTKHVNILIKCGTYTPAPLVSHNNPYQTSYRNISLIGENRNKCIIKNTIGFYDYTIGTDCAPLRLGGNVTIENLTVICTSEDFDEYSGTPGFVGRDDYRKAAYCIHRDWYDRQGDAFVIKNCTLINDHMACIGFGLKENTKLVVENCSMQSEQAAEHSQENDYAPLWGHISSGEKGLGQDLIVIGCTIVNKTGPYGFKFRWDVKAADATPQDTHASLTFQGNILKSTDSENIINIPAGGYGFWEITDVSFNNNVSQLNK